MPWLFGAGWYGEHHVCRRSYAGYDQPEDGGGTAHGQGT
jgi:hypothetical protein